MEEVLLEISKCLESNNCAKLEISITPDGLNFYVETGDPGDEKLLEIEMEDDCLEVIAGWICEDLLDVFDENKEKIVCYLTKAEEKIKVRIAM